MTQLSRAVETFSKDLNANFDLAGHQVQSSGSFLSMHFFFLFVHEFMKKLEPTSLCAAFDYALQILSERFLDALHHHLLRTGTALCTRAKLSQFNSSIGDLLPCSATKKFDGIDQPVHCENNYSNHGDTHQSSKTCIKKITDRFLSKFFGPDFTTSVACRWSGGFESNKKYAGGHFIDQELLLVAPPPHADFYHNHKKILASQNRILTKLNATMCLACLVSEDCTEILECGHKLCGLCCKELLISGFIECPFCARKVAWKNEDIPSGAGVRILSIHGKMVQGLSAAILLQQIEERIGVNIHQLFDLVTGTGSGALSALGYGILHMPGDRVVELLHNAAQVMDSPKDLIDRCLAKFIPNKRLFSGTTQMPRVAVEVEGIQKISSYTPSDIKIQTIARQACMPLLPTYKNLDAFSEFLDLWGQMGFRKDGLDIILDTSMA
jgi:hypothetical protein